MANSPSFEDRAVLEFFQTSGRNLLAAEAAAGVKHHVALSVVGTDRLLENGYFRAKMAQENLISSDQAMGVQGDVADLQDLDRLYSIVKSKHGHIDILFANAGLGNLAPIGQITEEHFDLHFNVNVKGLLFTGQKALPLMKEGQAHGTC